MPRDTPALTTLISKTMRAAFEWQHQGRCLWKPPRAEYDLFPWVNKFPRWREYCRRTSSSRFSQAPCFRLLCQELRLCLPPAWLSGRSEKVAFSAFAAQRRCRPMSCVGVSTNTMNSLWSSLNNKNSTPVLSVQAAMERQTTTGTENNPHYIFSTINIINHYHNDALFAICTRTSILECFFLI